MLVIADRERAQAVGGVMGGAALGGVVRDDDRGVRERVLQAGVGTADQQAARPEDRGLVTLRARRRPRRSGHRDPARDRADAADRRRPAGRVDRRRLPAAARGRSVCTCAATGSRASSAHRCPTRRSCASFAGSGLTSPPRADGWDVGRADLPRRSAARSRPHRGGGPSLRLRQARADVPGGDAAGAAAGSAHPARSAGAPRPDRRRFLRSGDVRLHRGEGRRGFRNAECAKLAKPRRSRAPRLALHDIVGIANPLSAKFDTLRPSLLPGLVDAVAHNRRHGRRDVQLFEIGTRFTPAGETRGVAVAWTGGAAGEHWSGGAREVDFFDIKGIVEHLSEALGVAVAIRAVARAVPRRRARRRRSSSPTVRNAARGWVWRARSRRPRRRARPAASGSRVRRRSGSRSAAAGARRRERCDAAAAAASVRRPRSVDRGRGYLACGNHSWHHSGGRRATCRRR